jgi:hypothetical protein
MRERLRALRYALRLYRCFVCQRPRALHTLRQRQRCDWTPLPIQVVAHLPCADPVEVEAAS